MQKAGMITNALTDDREYAKILKFCTEHGIYCFEYHYRHRTQKADRRTVKGGAAL